MLLIFSDRCNDSEYIRREVTVAGESHKVVIPFRIEDAQPKHGLRVRLSDLHWLDGFASRELAIDELIKTFPVAKKEAVAEAPGEQVLRSKEASPKAATADGSDRHSAKHPLVRSAHMLWGIAGIAIVAVVIAAGFSIRHGFFSTDQTIEPSSRTPAPPVSPPQQSASCRDVLCDTEWSYSDSTKSPAKNLGFLPDQVVIVGIAKGTYSLDGDKVYMEVNNKYAEYHGTLTGNQMRGYASNVNKFSWTWSATKR
jgi:hypothetical protein